MSWTIWLSFSSYSTFTYLVMHKPEMQSLKKNQNPQDKKNNAPGPQLKKNKKTNTPMQGSEKNTKKHNANHD